MTMSSHPETTHLPPPLDLSGWRKVPAVLMVVGGILSVIGAGVSPGDFGYSWLLAFMFYLTLSLGALLFVFIHHLSNAGWSVATRRVCEHLGSLLFPWLAVLFLPVGIFAMKIYPWMSLAPSNHLVAVKWPLFTIPGFWITSAIFFGIWWLMTARINYWSLRQDVTGEPLCAYKMRFHSGWGVVVLALTMVFAPVLWMQAVQFQWYSAIYGVYYFADCAWLALATLYILMMLLQRQRILDRVLRGNQFYFLGGLLLAFTLFQAYSEFAQYFVVWNANMPVETFWYLIREHNSWFCVSMILIFGHFVLPFFVLLPVSVKMNFKIMLPVCLWAWAMTFLDLSFNILPALHPHNYPVRWIWLQFGCFIFMGGFLSWAFLKKFHSHPPYPQRDPHVLEAMGLAHFEPEEMPDTLPSNGGGE
jgi:hypothetical protein